MKQCLIIISGILLLTSTGCRTSISLLSCEPSETGTLNCNVNGTPVVASFFCTYIVESTSGTECDPRIQATGVICVLCDPGQTRCVMPPHRTFSVKGKDCKIKVTKGNDCISCPRGGIPVTIAK